MHHKEFRKPFQINQNLRFAELIYIDENRSFNMVSTLISIEPRHIHTFSYTQELREK